MMMMMLTAQWDSNQTSGFRWWGLINVHQGLIESVFQEITKLYGLVYCPPLSLRLLWFLLDSSCKSLDKMCFCILNITNKNNNSFLFMQNVLIVEVCLGFFLQYQSGNLSSSKPLIWTCHDVIKGYHRHGKNHEDIIATPQTVQSQNGQSSQVTSLNVFWHCSFLFILFIQPHFCFQFVGEENTKKCGLQTGLWVLFYKSCFFS